MSEVTEQQLPELIRKMGDRINSLPPARADKLWLAGYILMGLRYPDELTVRLFEGVRPVKDSTTYQKILRDGRTEGLAEGRITEARRFLLRQGTKRFGTPDAVALAALEGIDDVDRLEELGDRILDADLSDWNDLLGLQ